MLVTSNRRTDAYHRDFSVEEKRISCCICFGSLSYNFLRLFLRIIRPQTLLQIQQVMEEVTGSSPVAARHREEIPDHLPPWLLISS